MWLQALALYALSTAQQGLTSSEATKQETTQTPFWDAVTPCGENGWKTTRNNGELTRPVSLALRSIRRYVGHVGAGFLGPEIKLSASTFGKENGQETGDKA